MRTTQETRNRLNWTRAPPTGLVSRPIASTNNNAPSMAGAIYSPYATAASVSIGRWLMYSVEQTRIRTLPVWQKIIERTFAVRAIVPWHFGRDISGTISLRTTVNAAMPPLRATTGESAALVTSPVRGDNRTRRTFARGDPSGVVAVVPFRRPRRTRRRHSRRHRDRGVSPRHIPHRPRPPPPPPLQSTASFSPSSSTPSTYPRPTSSSPPGIRAGIPARVRRSTRRSRIFSSPICARTAATTARSSRGPWRRTETRPDATRRCASRRARSRRRGRVDDGRRRRS